MNRILLVVAAAVSACGLSFAQAADQPPADVTAIRETVESYVAAFNRGAAEDLAAHWAEDGQFITPAGETFQGRAAIQKGFETFFKENSGVRVEVRVKSIRLRADTAIEEGATRVVRQGQGPTESDYVATYVKQDGKWMLKSIREAAPSPSHYQQLAELEWLIGEWVDQDENASVETVCRWTKNRNYISRSFAVSIADHVDLEGTQVIGWDPAKKVIRSWLFDSDGGFAVGLWTRDGDRWTISTLQVLADGAQASSMNILTRVDNDKFTWESVNRSIDGEVLPNIDPVTVVRK